MPRHSPTSHNPLSCVSVDKSQSAQTRQKHFSGCATDRKYDVDRTILHVGRETKLNTFYDGMELPRQTTCSNSRNTSLTILLLYIEIELKRKIETKNYKKESFNLQLETTVPHQGPQHSLTARSLDLLI